MVTVSAIVAFDEARVMGNGNAMPWHILEDFRHFKKTTMGWPVVMGRKTWDSLPRKPLPGRVNIVLTKSTEPIEGAVVCNSLREAIEKTEGFTEMFIIGGRTIYQHALDEKLIDRLIVSHVKGTHPGDVYFPDIPEYLAVTDAEYPKYELFEVKEYRRKT